MQAKSLLFNQEATEKLLSGVNKITKAVASSLGPRGRNTGIYKKNPNGIDEKLVIHDGIGIANSIVLKDLSEDFGAQVLKEASEKQVQLVGDGTTCVMILAQAIFSECVRIISTGVNAMSLINGLEQGATKLVKEMDKLAKPIKTLEEKIQIATISAEDAELGQMIGQTLDKIGVDGIITVEESKSATTTVEHQLGMQFDQGYISHLFATDQDKMEATVENTFILLSDKTVSNILELKPFLDKFVQAAKDLVIIAPDVTDSALQSFIITKLNGGMNINCVKAPSIKQKEWLEDIAILTGGTVIRSDAGAKFENIQLTDLGKAERVTSTKEATLIVGGKGSEEYIAARIKALRTQLETEESEYEQEKLKERIAKLGGGVAVIKVGGFTDIEMKDRKERALDSVAATRAAIEEGIVAGGETVYLRVLDSLDSSIVAQGILKRALRKPFDKLMQNADLDPGQMLERLENVQDVYSNPGVDVTDGQIKDLIKAGIVDPVKVPKCAIQNATSVAVKLMTVEVLITDLLEEKK